ncbi:peptidase family M48-domain-containing protein [Dichotomocladium elegans]|nr:peptidase family M48-domain-containing protein [Dichotomocladium elegans]
MLKTFVAVRSAMRRPSPCSPTLLSCRHITRQKVLRSMPRFSQKQGQAIIAQAFHTSAPRQSPLIPLPALLLTALKSGKLVSLVSLSSKTSLTLLPHTLYSQRMRIYVKFLAGIPIVGLSLLLLVGLDQAPNTGRLRLIYLTEAEEDEIVEMEVNQIIGNQLGLVSPMDSVEVEWLKTIVDNIAMVAVDDARDPVRKYNPEEKKEFVLFFVNDNTTVNAMCIGRYFVVYNPIVDLLEWDTNRMAVILSHEIAHSIQRHFVEQQGMASFMLMLGDMTRGAFWVMTEWLGPYINQKINEAISVFVKWEIDMTYNRELEKEADLLGLKLLAKAGYDPTVAIDVWTKIGASEVEIENELEDKEPPKYENLDIKFDQYVRHILHGWFGTTHPPTKERIEYMREHMDEAVQLYTESLRINGPPVQYIPPTIEEAEEMKHQKEITSKKSLSSTLHDWYLAWARWITHTNEEQQKQQHQDEPLIVVAAVETAT